MVVAKKPLGRRQARNGRAPTANDDDLDRGRIFTHEVPLARAHLEIATNVERRSQKRQKDEPNDIWKRRQRGYI